MFYSILWIFWIPRLIQDHSDLSLPEYPLWGTNFLVDSDLPFLEPGTVPELFWLFLLRGVCLYGHLDSAELPPFQLPKGFSSFWAVLPYVNISTLIPLRRPRTVFSIRFSFAPGFSRRVTKRLKFIKGIILFLYGIRTVPVLLCCSRCQIVYFAPYGFPTLRDCAGTPLAQLPLG